MNSLPLMKKLEYLNISSTSVTGEKLIKGFAYKIKNQQHSALKYLNIGSTRHELNYSVEEMKELSLFIPHLTYL